jgi:hypothetical protein
MTLCLSLHDCLSEASPSAVEREARNEPERNKRGV